MISIFKRLIYYSVVSSCSRPLSDCCAGFPEAKPEMTNRPESIVLEGGEDGNMSDDEQKEEDEAGETPAEESTRTFLYPDELSDLTLHVEGRRLFVHKAILASVSPVWKRMFTSEFREKHSREISLPDKKFNHIVVLLQWIYRSMIETITDENVFYVLPLAEEYQILKLKLDCEQVLLSHVQPKTTTPQPMEQVMEYMLLAQEYHLAELLDRTAESTAGLTNEELTKRREYPRLSSETKGRIATSRVILLEHKTRGQEKEINIAKRQCRELEEKCKITEQEIDRHIREKKVIQKYLHEIKDAWDNRGEEVRCGKDEVHTYCSRNYECKDCNLKVKAFVSSKTDQLLHRSLKELGRNTIKWPTAGSIL
ncbi:kelch-like protein 12 [Lingula anatina]|uniref:Kelch-like protein 12 n=1 Tax=Lingula anatina TaxID=7574 RepID=A0A1S3H1B8_LINAN|nr:kelch-like protein 12 [Lingula anatina]|eukprot:XP_013397337.1 kelch-like protein 12 [Lingula anatina]